MSAGTQAQASDGVGARRVYASVGTMANASDDAGIRAWRLIDMHCHLDRMANGFDVATEAAEREIAIFCTTVTPGDALLAQKLFGDRENVRVGVGLHPWWMDNERPTHGARSNHIIEQAAAMAAQSNYVGEIGLDFSPAHEDARSAQLDAFEHIVRACAEHPVKGRVVSIHAVRAAGRALDILEQYRLPAQSTCIFHWFSGTSDELTRLRRLGCHISVNERMLASKRGRAYARQSPLGAMHLETDAPPQLDAPFSAKELEASLLRTVDMLAKLRGIEPHSLATRMAQASAGILGV